MPLTNCMPAQSPPIHPGNMASRRVAEKIGLRLTDETAFVEDVRQFVYRLIY